METGRIRRRKDKGFAQIANCVLRDMELSLKAKGLYSLIESYLSIPDWALYKSFLMSKCKEGDTAFNGAWKELKDRGYLIQYKIKDKTNGRWIYEYELVDEPCISEGSQDNNTLVPDAQSPDTDFQGVASQGVETGGVNINTYNNNTYNNNTDLNNTDINKKNSKDKNINNNNNIESEEDNLSCSALLDDILSKSNYEEEEQEEQDQVEPETNQEPKQETKPETKQKIKTIVPDDVEYIDDYIKTMLTMDLVFKGLDFSNIDCYMPLAESIAKTRIQDGVDILGEDQWRYFRRTLINKLHAEGIIKNR